MSVEVQSDDVVVVIDESLAPVEVVVEPAETSVIVEAAIQGPKGDKGDPGASGASFIHNQIASSNTWIIQHNLGYYPNLTTVDTAQNTIEGDVYYNNIDEITINFETSITGTAYLS